MYWWITWASFVKKRVTLVEMRPLWGYETFCALYHSDRVSWFSGTVRDMRLSRRWRFKSRSSGLWRRVVLWYDTNVSKVHAASMNFFMAVMFQIELFWVVTPYNVVVGYQSSGCPCSLHLHYDENLKSRNFSARLLELIFYITYDVIQCVIMSYEMWKLKLWDHSIRHPQLNFALVNLLFFY